MDDPVPGDPAADPREEQLVEDLRRVYSSLQIANLPTWLRLDVTMAQLKAFVAIERAGETTVGGLAADLSIGESSASLLIDQLVKRGYVTRAHDEADRRRVLVRASEHGDQLISELRHGRRHTLHEWLADLDEGEAAALAQGLAALSRVAAAHTAAVRTDEAGR